MTTMMMKKNFMMMGKFYMNKEKYMELTLKEVVEAYKRFYSNKERYSSIYIYPNYEKDLDIILEYIKKNLYQSIYRVDH